MNEKIVKQKNMDRVGFKLYLGTAIMGLTDGITSALMMSWFMIYLTDYAGLGALGAVVGSSVLLLARIFDAVNDPLEGFIMDRAKKGRYGKYKPFIILSIVMCSVGVSGLFFVPTGNDVAITCIWVVIFYLIYDIGASFFAPNLIYRTLSLDQNQRGKLMIAPRVIGMMVGMFAAALMSIVNGINGKFNNMHTSFGVTVICIVAILSIISLAGICLVKERYHAPEEKNAERVKLKDFFLLIKENAALRVSLSCTLFGGFIWTLLFSTSNYYIKWGFCTDLTTGQVDSAAYGLYVMVASALMFLPLLFGTFFAAPLMKKIGSPMATNRLLLLFQAIPCGILFVLQMMGMLQKFPALFFLCVGISATAIGCGFIPGSSVDMEVMDYQIYKNGKDRSALCNAFTRFLSKAQGAVATASVGYMLAAIGYVVDSATGDFAGNIDQIPVMLDRFTIIMGLVPCFFGLIAWAIAKRYPITPVIREDMQKKLRKQSDEV